MIELQRSPFEFAEPSASSYFDFISDFLKNPKDDFKTHLRAAVHNILSLCSEEAAGLPSLIAKEVLKEVGGRESAAHLLAQEILTECQQFASQFIPSQFIQDRVKKKQKFFELYPKEQLIFTRNGRLFLDELFARHIGKIGPQGKELAKALNEASVQWRQAYLVDKNALHLFRLWVDLDIPPYYCRFLKLMGEILWKDRVEEQFNKYQHHLPALTQSVLKPLCQILSTRTEIVEGAVAFEGKIIAQVPAIDPRWLPLVQKGMGFLNTLYHHKLLRFECKMGFEQWIRGKTDLLRFERGETELAELLGFKFKEAPAILKSLLLVQAHANFHFDDKSSAPLISLKEFRSKITNREEGIEIILGTHLMPHYTFQTSRKGRLLVPLPDWPPFVSAPQYHAGQALLQMLILEEFTNQSIELALEGSIEIKQERWDELLKQSGLPLSVFKQACARWLIDGEDGPCFLIQVEWDRYTLGERYAKELQFLSAQGTLRNDRREQARISARKKRVFSS
ncbi:MAG: hypothetical protein JSS32_08015 [Verrucomicrobia bacterium]|nr:hypothetical protein [Verrucomicrobiota bacterium]